MFRQLSHKICLIFVGLSLGFVFAEVGVRLTLPPPQSVKVTLDNQVIPSDPAYGLYYGSADIFQMRPRATALIVNHVHSHRDIPIRTNSLGFRGPEVDFTAAERVLFLGDSITVADSVLEEQTFVALVEQNLSNPGRKVQCLNAGQGATGLLNHYNMLRRYFEEVQPTLVVLGFYLNDFQNSPWRRTAPLPGCLSRSWLLAQVRHTLWWRKQTGIHPQLLNFLDAVALERWRGSLAATWKGDLVEEPAEQARFHDYLQTIVFDAGGAWVEEAWAIMEPIIVDIKTYLAAKETPLLVVVFPIKAQVEANMLFDYPQQRMRALGDRHQFPVLDLLPALRTVGAEGLFYDHCHLTPAGHRLTAAEIYKFINKPGADEF